MNIQSTTDAESTERARIQSDSQHGVIGSWFQLAIGMSEASTSFGFGLVQDTRVEARRRAEATITFAEEMGVGSFRYLRKVIDRCDRMLGEVLGRSEATVLVVTRTLRKTGHGVTDLATTTLTDTIGSPQITKKAEAAIRTAAS